MKKILQNYDSVANNSRKHSKNTQRLNENITPNTVSKHSTGNHGNDNSAMNPWSMANCIIDQLKALRCGETKRCGTLVSSWNFCLSILDFIACANLTCCSILAICNLQVVCLCCCDHEYKLLRIEFSVHSIYCENGALIIFN